ncbi:hypothetical protein Purlil1_1399 [Purpureocillium lilacinum]|uniref:Uncharacterized protein n=1 Tax=Purpureocillium lilacinum TaxID=33203 RepID=A0ABR0CDE0_PURLI|nr:hypothetical protein Purlil1_1399 [Purpureocillium lilacinum]
MHVRALSNTELSDQTRTNDIPCNIYPAAGSAFLGTALVAIHSRPLAAMSVRDVEYNTEIIAMFRRRHPLVAGSDSRLAGVGWHKHGKAQAISTTADRRSHEGSPPSGAMAAATLDQGVPSGCDAEHAGNPNRKMALGNGCYFKQADRVFIPPGQGSSSASTTWSNSDAEPLQGRMNSS